MIYRKNRLLAAALLLLGGLTFPNISAAQEDSVPFAKVPATVSASNSEAPFSEGFPCYRVHRSARVLNPRVMVGEPLYIEIILEGHPHKLDKTTRFVQPLRFGQDLHLVIKPPQGRPFPHVPPRGHTSLDPNVSFDLAEGERRSVIRSIAFDANSVSGGLFDTAGQYVLDLWMDCHEPSNPNAESREHLGRFPVEVWMPQRGSQDLIALNILMNANDPQIFLSLQEGIPVEEDHVAAFQQIIENAPDSVLYRDALMITANYYLHNSGVNTENLNEENLRKSADLLEKALQNDPGHHQRGLLYMRLMILYKSLGENERSFEYAKKLWQDPAFVSAIPAGSNLYLELAGEREVTSGRWMIFEDPADAVRPGVDQPAEESDGAMQQQIQDAIDQLLVPGGPETVEIMPGGSAP